MPRYLQNLKTFICRAEFTPQLSGKIAVDIAKGLEYLHQNNILHRDLKPENILVCNTKSKLISQIKSADFSAVISDFGLARPASNSMTPHACGTEGFIAPEIVAKCTYGAPADVSASVISSNCVIYLVSPLFFIL